MRLNICWFEDDPAFAIEMSREITSTDHEWLILHTPNETNSPILNLLSYTFNGYFLVINKEVLYFDFWGWGSGVGVWGGGVV